MNYITLPFRLAFKTGRYLCRYGVKRTYEKVKTYCGIRIYPKTVLESFSKKVLNGQRETQFSNCPKISIITPLYNTPIAFLREMIESVKSQTYANWELCLGDGSEASVTAVQSLCESYAQNDSRIKYVRLDRNYGISGNTNKTIELATGSFLAPVDHDDILHPSALFEVAQCIDKTHADFMYTDEITFSQTIEKPYRPHLKPDFAPDLLRSYNYICHLIVFEKKLFERVGPYDGVYDGSQDYDMVLRLSEKARHIVHIPKILYYWREHTGSVAHSIDAKPYAIAAACKALSAHLERCGLQGIPQSLPVSTRYRINYELEGMPLISIIIANKDSKNTLEGCINSIVNLSTYANYEILIVENNSSSKEIFEYYKELESRGIARVIRWEKGFNYPAIHNYACNFAKGEFLLLLNNDIEVITPNWIEEMLMYAQRQDVGLVGAMLYYPDDTVQHAGVIVGIEGCAGHAHKHVVRGAAGYMDRLLVAQNFSAVTAACMLVRKSVYKEVGGMNEEYAIAFNDVDFCMRVRKAGYLVVFTPFAELYHHESKSRGYEDTPEKQKRFEGEVKLFRTLWEKELEKGDPYYHPKLTLKSEDFSIIK